MGCVRLAAGVPCLTCGHVGGGGGWSLARCLLMALRRRRRMALHEVGSGRAAAGLGRGVRWLGVLLQQWRRRHLLGLPSASVDLGALLHAVLGMLGLVHTYPHTLIRLRTRPGGCWLGHVGPGQSTRMRWLDVGRGPGRMRGRGIASC